MFEKEISNYAFNITKRYTSDRVSLSSLMTDVELPEGFRRFAEAEVKEIIDKEDLERSKTGKFDFSRPEVMSLLKEVRHVLRNSFEFSREEFLELTDRASKFIFNYVIRPRWTLEKFLFKGEPDVNRENIEKAARFLNDYPYYPKGILEYMEMHNLDKVDVETWKKLHGKIDEHLLSALPSKAANLASALLNLFQFSTGNERVPTDAFILFFRDKTSPEYVDRLEFAKELKNIQSIDSATLAMILEATSRDVDQNIAVLKTPEEPPREFRSFERQTVTNPLFEEEIEEPEEPGRGEKEPEETRQAPPEPVPESVKEEAKPMDQQLPQTPEPPPKQTRPATPSIRSLMSPKLEGKIVKRIFHGSRSGYQIAVHKLDESPNWEIASKVVEGIFIDNEVDPFSKYAVTFTDVVSAKFRATRTAGTKF